jgi:hypothetical protein
VIIHRITTKREDGGEEHREAVRPFGEMATFEVLGVDPSFRSDPRRGLFAYGLSLLESSSFEVR